MNLKIINEIKKDSEIQLGDIIKNEISGDCYIVIKQFLKELYELKSFDGYHTYGGVHDSLEELSNYIKNKRDFTLYSSYLYDLQLKKKDN